MSSLKPARSESARTRPDEPQQPGGARIDHAVIFVAQALEAAAKSYERLGFCITPRGHHSMGSSNHLFILQDDYVELLGVEPQDVARFGAGWNHPVGLSGLVFKTGNAEALWKRLTDARVPLEGHGPDSFSRPVTLEDGQTGDAAFRVVRVALDQVPNGRVFFCEQQTPHLVWRAAWQQHPNGADGLLEFVYALEKPESLGALLGAASGAGPAEAVEGGLRIQLGNAAVLILSPQAAAHHYGIDPAALPGPLPRAVGLTLHTRSIQALQDVLQRNRIPNWRSAAGHVVIGPDDAAGTLLAFTQAS